MGIKVDNGNTTSGEQTPPATAREQILADAAYKNRIKTRKPTARPKGSK